MNKELITKLKNIGSGFMRGLASNPLFAIALLFSVVLVMGALIFYRYDVLAEFTEPKTAGEPVQFQKESYQQILNEWQTREARFKTANAQNYINPFQEKREKIILTVPEEPKVVSVNLRPLGASNLLEFYALKGEMMPLVAVRANIWQEFGLGSAQNYIGSKIQNQQLLAELKKRLQE